MNLLLWSRLPGLEVGRAGSLASVSWVRFSEPSVRSPCFYFSENSHFLEENTAPIDFIVNLIGNLSEF